MRYSLGVFALLVAVVPIATAAVTLRRRYLPSWSAPASRLVEAIIALSVVVMTGQVLGTAGLFRLVPVTLVLCAIGCTVTILLRDSLRPRSNGAPTASVPRTQAAAWIGLVVVAMVAAGWLTRTLAGLEHGLTGLETLRYHMPIAARFADLGDTTSLFYVNTDAGFAHGTAGLIAFYPNTSELLHAYGILFLGSDILSVVLNLGFFSLAILAGYVAGSAYGAGPASLVGAGVVVGLPQLVGGQPGTGDNDIAGIAFVVASVAVLLYDAGSRRSIGIVPFAVAGLAAGLALGTKFSFIPFVAALTVSVIVVLTREQRWRYGLVWTLMLLSSGGYWYIRNLVVTGNPLPVFELGIGPIELDSAYNPVPDTPLATFLFKSEAWNDFIFPALRADLGPVWWSVVFLAVLGIGLGMFAGDRMQRAIAAAAAFTVLGFVLLPQAVSSTGEAPDFLAFNMRYVMHALLIGLVLLPIALACRGRSTNLLALVYGVIVVVSLSDTLWGSSACDIPDIDNHRACPIGIGRLTTVLLLAAALPLVAGKRYKPSGTRRLVGVVALSVLIFAGGTVLYRWYADNRESQLRSSPVGAAVAELSDKTIGVSGEEVVYGYYGPELENHVVNLTEERDDGSRGAIADCKRWRDAIYKHGLDYVAVSSGILSEEPPAAQAWLDSDPNASLVVRAGTRSLYQITGDADPEPCSTDGALSSGNASES